MSSLRERVEGLVQRWREVEHFSEASTARSRACADELAAALAAEGQGEPVRDILHNLRMKLGAESMIEHRVNDYITEHLDRMEAALPIMYERIRKCLFCGSEVHSTALGYAENPYCTKCLAERIGKAAAPSLHKEGAGGERLTGTQVLAAVNECVDLHGIGPDFPATWVDSNINFNELAESLNRRLATLPALPLQRTLPDEQFKGAVVEPIGAETDEPIPFPEPSAYTRSDSLKEIIALLDANQELLFGIIYSREKSAYEWMIRYERLRASPAGRAYSPKGNFCSICRVHDEWCGHIQPPAGRAEQEPK